MSLFNSYSKWTDGQGLIHPIENELDRSIADLQLYTDCL